MNIHKHQITIGASDGYPLAATYFKSEQPTHKTVIVGPAMGVPRYIYFKLAQFLADHGFSVLTFDYRGVHESQSEDIMGSNIRMADWGQFDIEAALQWADQQTSGELFYLAHSCGGQLLGMAPTASKISKSVFLASQSGYWKLWPFPQKWGVWASWSIMPLITPWFNDFPARKLGLSSVNIPSGVARQWARWGKSPHYLWDFLSESQLSRYKQLSFHLLAYGFTDDRYFGPPKAIQQLLTYYPNTKSTLRILSPADYQQKTIGHFGILKDGLEHSLWQEIVDWFNS